MAAFRYHDVATDADAIREQIGALDAGDKVWVSTESGGFAGTVGSVFGDSLTVDGVVDDGESAVGVLDVSGERVTAEIVTADLDVDDLDDLFDTRDCGAVELVATPTDGFSVSLDTDAPRVASEN